MNNKIFTILIKKVFPLVISLMILSNIFSFTIINNINDVDISNNCATNTLTHYCNIVVFLPINVVSSFFKDKLNLDVNFGYTKNRANREAEKSNKKNEGKSFFHFAIFEKDFSKIQFSNSLTASVGINQDTSYIPVLSILSFVVTFMLIFIVSFKGSMILARGDTEDNIIKKINIENNVRLV
ncbi:MAG: hypothetical protein IKO48_06160 [Elusimicrobia bacterium]|nr:hypothetical protein [Elusimicrobiota bacterium]